MDKFRLHCSWLTVDERIASHGKNPLLMVKFPLVFGTQKKLIHQIGTIFSGWWFQPSPLKNDGVRQLGG